MRFGVLGPLQVWTDAGAEVTVPGTLVRALLADLLVHRGTVRSADRLVQDLWEDDPPGHPAGALQAKVSQLRRALGDAEPGGRALVVSRGPGYLLDVAPDAVDAGRFAMLVAAADGEPAARAARLGEALALWRGPALTDVADAAFARPAAAELAEQWLRATEAHLDARSALGEDDAVIGELTALTERHPLRERLHGALLRALYRGGRQAEALDHFEEVRARLADELGVDPSPELTALRDAILRQDADLDRREEPPRPPDGPPTNLPASWDETVGREDEIVALRAALGAARLVTVVGAGGVGKTRLATDTARTVVEEGGDAVRDGVWFVDLAGCDGSGGQGDGAVADAVADAVATAVGLRDDASTPRGSRAAQVVDAMRERRLVLVIDNCEHVVDAVADLVAGLVRRAPGTRVLATSREPLGLRGEHLRPVATLGLPEPDGDPARSPAVRLFVARAAGADPGFALTAANAPVVAAVCRRLDGLPLAIELAAARVRTLGLREVAARLDDRFGLLDSGPRDAPARQRTLRAVMDWSWDPLSDAERAVLRRLAATADGAGVDLVEAVCAGDPVPAGGELALVARLVDRSLVAAVETGAGTRWRMLETVAAYAGERLAESGEADAVRGRHAAAVADLVERSATGLRGADQSHWLERLDRESADVRAALDTAVETGDGPLALRIAVAADWYWYLRGRRSTARRSLARALEAARGTAEGTVAWADATAAHAAILVRERSVDDPLAVSAAALTVYDGLDAPVAFAHAAWRHADALGGGGGGDLDRCEVLVDVALRSARSAGDRWATATLLSERGTYDLMRGRLDAARAAADEAGVAFTELGDGWGQARAESLLGQLDEIDGDYAAATQRDRDGLRHAEELRLWPSVIAHLNRLGRLALLVGDHARADAHHSRAHALALEHGQGPSATFARLGLAMAARRSGRLADAAKHLRAVEADAASPYDLGAAITHAELGFLAEQRHDAAEARREHGVGMVAARRSGDARAVALALEGLAGAAAEDGEYERAGMLLGAADAARAGAGAPLPAGERGDVERIRARVDAALGTAAGAAAHERGRLAGPDGVDDGERA